MSITYKYKNYFLLSSIVVGFLVLINVILSNFSNEKQALYAKQLESNDVNKLVKEIELIKGDYQNVCANFRYVNEKQFRKFVEDTAKKYSININYFSPTREEMRFYTVIKLSLQISAGYKDLVDFLVELEENDVDVMKLDILRKDTGEKDITLSLQSVFVGEK